ncbi:phospholipid-translocating P-type ATPase [Aureobasidium sp. EXF-12298]|nr:phospholipid-translocating P-type ATPase [Aureobasidium sp. EXF-12298]KAI4760093.1 phospholipid-translocating P-type ATPase [Aureobasidium sp. EXF-12344]KAI4777089.1 phospholipid-translocating P-type ATPase [Aureobasidium sp. EXF-3400]
MAGHDDLSDDLGGVRRRHSAHYDHNDFDIIHARYDGLSGEPSKSNPSTSGTDIPTHTVRETGEQPSRVRFSLQEQRPDISSRGKKRKSDEDTRPNLSVDTNAAAAHSSVRSVTASSSSNSRPKMSPLSPQTRARGYSLRSSLFQRNMHDRSVNSPASPSSIIEMAPIGPSNQHGSSHTPVTPHSGKKSMETVVEVAQMDDDDRDLEEQDIKLATFEQRQGVQGIGALPHYQSWIQQHTARNKTWRSIKAGYHKARKVVLRIQEIPPTKDGRHIDLDASRKTTLLDERTGKAYITNHIRSSRYNAWNFVPRQLFAQFSKLANFYFLCISILQMIPGLSTTGSYTTIIPLLFFVALSMGKEGYDDLRRYRLDKTENNREASVLHAYQPVPTSESQVEEGNAHTGGPIHWAKTKWQNLQVGDIVKLERDESVPADLVLLRSKGDNGIAYIETMALDGETNLKSKQAPVNLAKHCSTPENISACDAHFVVEDPNIDLYNFEGKVTLKGETAPLTNNEIIYRGSILRNTSEAYGMVIYSGEECKIRMNSNKNPRIKAPALQAIVNKVVIVIVIFVVLLAIFNTVAYQVWRSDTEVNSWYLINARVAFFPVLTSFVIMFNTMIPLSLYVSMEIVKVWQMIQLNDIDMYDEVTNTPFEARTSTINEELGQVSYVFSDKTGTLTDNVMKFRKLSVAGTAWLHDVDLQDKQDDSEMLIHKKRSRKDKGKKPVRKSTTSIMTSTHKFDGADDQIEFSEHGRKSTSQWTSSARPGKAQPELSTKTMIRYIQRKPFTLFAKKARMLLLSMALCHTCLPETQEDGKIDFQASSPDELALVRAAQELGYLAVNRESAILTIKTFPNGMNHEPVLEQYQILDVIEFSSKRKRMSVTVRFPDGRVCVICKGADTIVMQRLKLASLANQKMVEIEKRTSMRKSLEAQEAIRRKSEQHERSSFARPSFSRPSFSLSIGRPSIGGIPRTSMGNAKLQPIRDELDHWLKERESEVDVYDEETSVHYSPRPSTHMQGRHSLAPSEARSSLQYDDFEQDELVEESLATDEATVTERCFQHINDFATEGLRTLLYAYRFLDEQEYLGWKKVYHDAATSLVNRQQMIEDAGEIIERDLDLGGATAIEDKLQKGVPEAIDKLRRANIKMWMLTGDKRETAINIGHSCRLIKDYSAVTILDHETGRVEQRIATTILDINNNKVAHSVVVIDGQTLALIEEDEYLNKLFFELAVLADSVICCRASPSQKAGLVSAVRRKVKNSITLAIGDGANDIAMIQEAHVGIGITGKEGLQAARTSDYSIAQFRFLVKLLLVHGHWNYIRICKYTVGTFWKEFMFYLTQALYQRWTGYTGTSLYESWSLSMFNTLFTSLPVIFLGVFEKDLLPQTLIAVPELYTKGQRNGGFNFKIFFAWIFMASSEAIMIYFIMFGLYAQASFTKDQGLYALGSLSFTACIILISMKLQVIENHNKSIMTVIACVLSVGGWFLWMIILASIYVNNYTYNVKDSFFVRFGDNLLWWLTLLLIVVATMWFEFGVKSLKTAYFATDVDLFQMYERDLEIRKRFEEAAAMELQAGWHHGTKKSSFEQQRENEVQTMRENEIQDLLNRPRVMEEGDAKSGVVLEEQTIFVADGPKRASTDIQEMLSRRFGSVKKGGIDMDKK